VIYRSVDDGYLVRLEKGEEIIAALTEFVRNEKIPAGFIAGMGAVNDAVLGIYIPARAEYFQKEFKGDLEVGNLTGNVAWLSDSDEPFVHCHVTVANRSLEAFTGHLFQATVSVTLEVHITRFKKKLLRKKDNATGFNFWDL